MPFDIVAVVESPDATLLVSEPPADMLVHVLDVGMRGPAGPAANLTAYRTAAQQDALDALEAELWDAALDVEAAARVTGLAAEAVARAAAISDEATARTAGDTAARARENHTGTQTAATIVDIDERIRDTVAAFLAAGTNVTLTHDDAGDTFTVTAANGTSFDAEAARDALGVALVGVGNISVAVNDAADTITISTTATANSTDAALRDRATHTGQQNVSTITGLATVATSGAYSDLTGKPTTMPPAAHTHAYPDITDKPTAFVPIAHAASHASGGADALALAASQITSGQLAVARVASGTATDGHVPTVSGGSLVLAAPTGGGGGGSAATASTLGTVRVEGTPTDAASPLVLVAERAQRHLGQVSQHIWATGSGSSLTSIGSPPVITHASGASLSHPVPTTTADRRLNAQRAAHTHNTAVSTSSGIADNVRIAQRGSANGLGGFRAFFRVAVEATFSATTRCFFGLTFPASGFPGAVETTAHFPAMIGIGCDSTDTAFQILTSGITGVFTKTALTTPVSKTVTAASNLAAFDIEIAELPYAGGAMGAVVLRVSNWVTGDLLFAGTLSGNLPTAAHTLGRTLMVGNGSVAPATAPAYSFTRVVLETDY